MVSKMLRFCSLFAYQIWFVLNNIQYCDGTRASALTKPSMVLINHHPSRQLLWHLQKQVTWIHTLHTRGRPHTFESLLSKWRSVCPGWIKIGPDSCLCLTVGNLDSKVDPSFVWNKIPVFSTLIGTTGFKPDKIIVQNGCLYWKKKKNQLQNQAPQG